MAAAYLGFTLDAMDTHVYAFVLPVLLGLWGLGHGEAGLLAGAALVASALGGWVAGALSDRIGRLRMLKITVCWFAVATLLCAFARGFDQLLVARVLQGVGFGGEWAVGTVFVSEIAPPRLRGRIVGVAHSAWAVGWGLAALLSALLFAVLPPETGWRVIFAVGALPAILVFALRRRLAEPEAFAGSERRAPWHAIFAGEARAATIKGCLLATGVQSGYWGLAIWLPTILRSERGFSSLQSTAYLGVLILGSFLGYLVGALVNDSLGRRATLATYSIGALICVLAYTLFAASDAALLLLGFPLGFFATGIFSAVGLVLTELYSTSLRGSGLGFTYNFGRGMAGAAPLVIGLSEARLGLGPALGVTAAGAYGLVLLTVLLLKETRGTEFRAA